MDNCESPRQHRKQRLQALHPRRIEGRTDSNTFFSTIQSVQGHTCIQIFILLLSKFIYIHLMKRKSTSHGAYQDFICKVGAPNLLHTNNLKTQTGDKWRQISRVNVTEQINSAPHDQNQNHSE